MCRKLVAAVIKKHENPRTRLCERSGGEGRGGGGSGLACSTPKRCLNPRGLSPRGSLSSQGCSSAESRFLRECSNVFLRNLTSSDPLVENYGSLNGEISRVNSHHQVVRDKSTRDPLRGGVKEGARVVPQDSGLLPGWGWGRWGKDDYRLLRSESP